ncbi:hypothetical protein EZV62_006128 [Acer yangbiense]|uniref:Transmembrane protein n=1 Tax=Acer yangbiense TaxID=1000413 RepID=A0A5C7IPA8_9ROSI|nr:hypothetical protein EZV62_006128 [Acer yangbiense]
MKPNLDKETCPRRRCQPATLFTQTNRPLHSKNSRYLLEKILHSHLCLDRFVLCPARTSRNRKLILTLIPLFKLFNLELLLLLWENFKNSQKISGASLCHRSWIPSVCSLLCSLGMIWAVRYKSDVESHLERLLEREKEDGNLLAKCVEELKKKGIEFDLLKEVDALRRAKSLRVEAKIVKKWSARDFVTMFFFTVSCLVLGLTRVILCS